MTLLPILLLLLPLLPLLLLLVLLLLHVLHVLLPLHEQPDPALFPGESLVVEVDYPACVLPRDKVGGTWDTGQEWQVVDLVAFVIVLVVCSLTD